MSDYKQLRSHKWAGKQNILNPAFPYVKAAETDLRRRPGWPGTAYGKPEHNPQPVGNAEIVKLTRRAK